MHSAKCRWTALEDVHHRANHAQNLVVGRQLDCWFTIRLLGGRRDLDAFSLHGDDDRLFSVMAPPYRNQRPKTIDKIVVLVAFGEPLLKLISRCGRNLLVMVLNMVGN